MTLATLLRAWLLALAAALFTSTAGAHASLIGSSPADGEALVSGPSGASLSFDEPVRVLVLSMSGPAGAAIPLTREAAGSAATVRIPLPPDLPQGAYLLSYRVLSADSHPVAGSVAFSVGPGQGSLPAGTRNVPPRGGH